jgi:hypothetical protein
VLTPFTHPLTCSLTRLHFCHHLHPLTSHLTHRACSRCSTRMAPASSCCWSASALCGARPPTHPPTHTRPPTHTHTHPHPPPPHPNSLTHSLLPPPRSLPPPPTYLSPTHTLTPHPPTGQAQVLLSTDREVHTAVRRRDLRAHGMQQLLERERFVWHPPTHPLTTLNPPSHPPSPDAHAPPPPTHTHTPVHTPPTPTPTHPPTHPQGKLKSYSAQTGKFTLQYDDGTSEQLLLERERFVWHAPRGMTCGYRPALHTLMAALGAEGIKGLPQEGPDGKTLPLTPKPEVCSNTLRCRCFVCS